MLGIGVIGFGRWGARLAAALAESGAWRVAAIADTNPGRLAGARAAFPDSFTTRRAVELMRQPDVTAVAIATPPATHYRLACAALAAGRHVLVEKPLADTERQCRTLAHRARHLVLAVDHTLLYDDAVQRMRALVRRNALGSIVNYHAVRITAGPRAPDCDVIRDLAVHDLAMMDFVLPLSPVALRANGSGPKRAGQRCRATITLDLAGGATAQIHVGWAASAFRRRTTITGTRRTLVLDELRPGARLGFADDTTPIITESAPPLTALARDFARAIRTGKPPRADVASAGRVMRLLEAAGRKLSEETAKGRKLN